MERSKKIFVLGAAFVIALLAVTFFMADNFTSTTDAAGGGPEMILTVKTGGECDGSKCTVPLDGSFTLAVEIVDAPTDYILAQSFIEFGSDLIYKPTDTALEEFVWDGCTPSSIALRDQLEPTSVLHGCLTGIFEPFPVSNYVGNLIDLSMNCSSGESSTLVELLPFVAGQRTSGALFKDADQTEFIPKVSNLTINCGTGPPPATPTEAGPTEPPTITPTEGPTDVPTETPVPTVTPTPSPQLCGDVNASGTVDAVDALLILQVEAGLIASIDRLAKPGQADVNSDDNVDSRDAALIQQVVADLLAQDRLTC